MKYTLTNETRATYDLARDIILHKIAYTEEFKKHILDKYDIALEGGWLESEENLSQDGDCFVKDDARVYGYAHVKDSAIVFGNAKIFGNAIVYGNAWVYGDAIVYGDAYVYEDASVFGSASVHGDARICGNAQINQSVTCFCCISTTVQWYEYQYTIAELNKKFSKERAEAGKWIK